MYEFLPDFCYAGGIIGHTKKFCEKKVEKGTPTAIRQATPICSGKLMEAIE